MESGNNVWANGSYYWLASPLGPKYNKDQMIIVHEANSISSVAVNASILGVRPLICIPTTTFNNTYMVE